MKTHILLKVLQNSATKANPNYKNNSSRKGDAGYTILELLVVVIMLGILASIAAPGWLGFINRQRVRTVNDRVFQSFRTAQSEAKRNKRDVTITFDKTGDPPKVTFNPPLATGGSEQKLDAGGEIKPGTIALTFNRPDPTDSKKSSLVFDYQGNLTTGTTTPFIVVVAPVGGGGKQCAIVETLIGGMRTAEGNDCPTLP
jgi:prepilin-type N-terminal cleavage/methylation domain-containing protein